MSVDASSSAAQSPANSAATTATTKPTGSPNASTTVSTVTSATSASAASTPSFSPAKLQPAPAPLVSAWGKKASSPSTSSPSAKSPQNGIQTQQWPTAEAALDSATVRETSLSSSIHTSPSANKSATIAGSKVKTGKEKWVPFEATIVLPSATGNNKKKNNNRKKQGQGKQQQQGKGGKDGKSKKSNSGDNKSQSSKSSAVSDKKVENITKGVEDLKVGSKSSQKGENGTKESSVPVESLESKAPDSKYQTKSKESDAEEDISSSKQNTQKEGSTSPYQPHPAQTSNHQNNFKKRYAHRNSEPANHYNQSYQQGGYSSHKSGNRRYNPGNRNNFNNYRHSIAGSNYSPYLLNPNGLNYGFLPVVQPPLNFGNNYYQNSSSRSNSGSPPAEGFAQLDGVNTPLPGNNFYPNPLVYQPYETLTVISNQVAFYFSVENLVKDIFLRKQMNSKGFVPLKKLISFNRLKSLTGGDIQLLKTAVQQLPQLEVVNEKVRASERWENWILPYENRDEAGKEEEEDTPASEVSKTET